MQRILFLGDMNFMTTTFHRVRAMCDLGYDVFPLSYVPVGYYPGITTISYAMIPQVAIKIFHKSGYPLDLFCINQNLIKMVHALDIDLIWCEKPLMLRASTLKYIKKTYKSIKIVFYSEDDMYARHNWSHFFLKSLPYYDIVYTNKSYNCNPDELPSLGARKVVFVDKAFCKYTHRPLSLTEEEKEKWGADVGFIGSYERDRADKILYLANNGIKVRVWGIGWECMHSHPGLILEKKPAYLTDYTRVLNATKINLCFLRKINRDLQTDRSMEIPACRAFMLAERTSEHLRLFEEGKEAEFFDIDKPEELLAKVRYYLTHDKEREAIARGGYERCLRSGYSHHDRLKYMFSFL